MITPSPAFLRYIDRAREGRIGLWRILLGIVLIVVVWAASTVGAFVAGVSLVGPAEGIASAGDPWAFISDFLNTPGGAATVLVSFVGMSAGVFLAVRLVHRRPFGSVLGASGRLSWGGFARGLAAALIASALAEIVTFSVDPSLQRSAIGVGAWLLWLVPLTMLLFIQISAEELAFRGYLPQSLAARFRSPLIWAVLPTALFTALHWDGQSSTPMLAAMLVSIAAFAVTAMVLLVKTGNLGAGMGVHLGLNMFGIMFVSHTSWLSGAALFRGRPLDTGDWSGLDAFFVGLFGVASFALMLLLLLHRRSPLKVGEA